VAELVFNLGQVGISDWEDWETKTVPVPADPDATVDAKNSHHL
jgi:hypothetical protein